MAIGITDNFLYQGRKPLDSRIVKNTIADMTKMAESVIYDGIMVYVKDTKKFYVFNSKNSEDASLKKWRELETGAASSGNAVIEKYSQNVDYKEDTLIIHNSKLYLVLGDFTSNNTETTTDDSFKLDLNNNKIIAIDTDTDTHSIEYVQNEKYLKGNLIVFDKNLYIALNDFTSDSTKTKIEDSLQLDVDNQNITPVVAKSEIRQEEVWIEEADVTVWNAQTTISNPLDKSISPNYLQTVFVINDSTKEKIIGIGKVDSYNDTDDEYTVTFTKIAEYKDVYTSGYEQGKFYKKGTLLIVNDKLYIASKDFISKDTETNLEDNFNKDIDLGNLIDVDTNTDTNCIEYAQNTKYTTDKIVRHNNKLYVVITDFTSNNTEANSDLGFEIDLQNGNLAPVVTDKKVSKVLAYTQATKYDKDTLVYVGSKIARVDIDYTSDATAASVELSFELDIANSKLVPISSEDFAAVLPYTQDTDYLENTLVFLGEKIARVESNYKSNNSAGFTLNQSFEDDIKNNKISLINTDHVKIMNEYAQSNMYFKDTLVYCGNLISRVMNDFIADSTGTTVEDSFDKDVTAGNLLILNKEAEPRSNSI